MKEQLERSNNARFAEEFSYFLKSTIFTLRFESDLMGQEMVEGVGERNREEEGEGEEASDKKGLLKKKKKKKSDVDADYLLTWNRPNYERIHLLDIRNLYDMLVNFHEANLRVIAEKRNGSRLFLEFTDIIGRVLEIFDKIPVEIDDFKRVTLISIPEL